MNSSFKTRYQTWRNSWKKLEHDKEFLWSSFVGVIVIVASFIASSFASAYATVHAGAPIADAILSNLPAMNIFWLYAYVGPGVGVILLAYAMIAHPNYIPLTLKALGIGILLRSVSVCLTHLGVPSGEFIPPHVPEFFKKFFLAGDLFFSGHAGFPLVLALVYWNRPRLRAAFLFGTVLLAFVVLAGHYHYSIDVFAALLIMPTVFMITQKIFPRDFTRTRIS